jgi:NADH:ubiquinone oxidoreductase subunit E
MEGKIDLQICLGSSCFSRGNKRIVRVIEEYLKENNLNNMVYFHGGHCFSECEKGPTLLINGKSYYQLDEEKVLIILDNLFSTSNKSI